MLDNDPEEVAYDPSERVCPECHFAHREDENHPVPILTPDQGLEMEERRKKLIRRDGIEVIAHDYLESIDFKLEKHGEILKDTLENQQAQTSLLHDIRGMLVVITLVMVVLALFRHC